MAKKKSLFRKNKDWVKVSFLVEIPSQPPFHYNRKGIAAEVDQFFSSVKTALLKAIEEDKFQTAEPNAEEIRRFLDFEEAKEFLKTSGGLPPTKKNVKLSKQMADRILTAIKEGDRDQD
jgi:hypothetical protein